MDIKGIAKIVGVSPATVSKIINNKDGSISETTRERVLAVVKEYNYVPYAKVQKQNAHSLLLGIILQNRHQAEWGSFVSEYAAKLGYSTVVLYTDGQEKNELRSLSVLEKQNVDGVLWSPILQQSSDSQELLQKIDKPICAVRLPKLWQYNSVLSANTSLDSFYIDYQKLGKFAATELSSQGHTKIVCHIPRDTPEAWLFADGCKKALKKLDALGEIYILEGDMLSPAELVAKKISSILCFDTQEAVKIWGRLLHAGIQVPQRISIVALGSVEDKESLPMPLTLIEVPKRQFAEFVTQQLIARIEKQSKIKKEFIYVPNMLAGMSLGKAETYNPYQITVVGSINIDTTLNLRDFPQTGETVLADSYRQTPGGKGANQAIAAAKLGEPVNLIGRIGGDSGSVEIYEELRASGVNVKGVLSSPGVETGRAYVHVKENGESSILVYVGANRMLSPQDIETNREIFTSSRFCLVQTEVPLDTVETAIKVAVESGCEVVLKPASLKTLDKEWMPMISYFVPNRKEAQRLCPHTDKIEEQAQYFRDMGAKHVLITLDKDGCYLLDDKHAIYFDAADVKVRDTTGAADAFCATLATLLNRDIPLVRAIQLSNYAAGVSTTQQGTQTGLLDDYALRQIDKEIDALIRYNSVK